MDASHKLLGRMVGEGSSAPTLRCATRGPCVRASGSCTACGMRACGLLLLCGTAAPGLHIACIFVLLRPFYAAQIRADLSCQAMRFLATMHKHASIPTTMRPTLSVAHAFFKDLQPTPLGGLAPAAPAARSTPQAEPPHSTAVLSLPPELISS